MEEMLITLVYYLKSYVSLSAKQLNDTSSSKNYYNEFNLIYTIRKS